jgi:hypothetical protein
MKINAISKRLTIASSMRVNGKDTFTGICQRVMSEIPENLTFCPC